MPSFHIKIANKADAVYHLTKPLTSIGSAEDSDLRIADPLIAEAFGHVHFDGQIYTIATLSGKANFRINGRKRKKHTLRDGDQISIGSATLTFRMIDLPASAEDASETRLRAYESIYQFSEKLMRRNSVPELLDTLLDSVIDLTKGNKGFLILLDGEELVVSAARNVQQENILDAIGQLSDSIIAKVVDTKQPLYISDAMNDEEFKSSESVMKLSLTSVMCVPLLDQGKLLGVIYVGSDSPIALFSEEMLRQLTILSAQASLIVKNALLVDQLQLSNQQLIARLETMRFGSIIGACPSMQHVFRRVEKVAATDVAVLITGETGTGKELIAREIHARSSRSEGPFITVNCGAIPEALLESEFFGHVRGAFTGAVANKLGRFQAAHKGTLFLDEIGEMPLALQVKLLRALQEHVVTRVGATEPEAVDVRILTATHRDLEEEVANQQFREDLFYRLNVINVHLPPLRDRGEDILAIARYVLDRCRREFSSGVQGFSSEGEKALRTHSWPGNVRELENRIKKAIVLADSPVLGAQDMGLEQAGVNIEPLVEAKERFQRDYINRALSIFGGNRTQTAKALGVDPRTIFRHLEKSDE